MGTQVGPIGTLVYHTHTTVQPDVFPNAESAFSVIQDLTVHVSEIVLPRPRNDCNVDDVSMCDVGA